MKNDTLQGGLSIKIRLTLVTLALGFLAIAIGIAALIGLRAGNEAIRTAYEKQLTGAIALGNTEAFIGRQRTSLDQAALNPRGPIVAVMLAKEQEMLAESRKWWSDFLAIKRDSTEQALVDAVADKIALTERDIDNFRAVIAKTDVDNIPRMAAEVGKSYTLMQAASRDLKAYQAKNARGLYDDAQARYTRFLWLGAIALALCVAAIAYGRWTIRNAIGRPIDIVLAHFEKMRSGDLSGEIRAHSGDEMGRLLQGLAAMRDGLIQTVSTVRGGCTSIAAATSEIAAGNMDLSSRTEEQAAALQQTAASMEELSSTVSQNARNADRASELATSAADVARRGSDMVSTLVTTMGEINESSARIADITTLIEGVAFQTNILALNAAVEAARAGEMGRGFAVVAGEVRSLAQRSSSAASDIKKLIGESVERSGRGASQAQEAGTTIREMNGAVDRVAKLIAEISSASGEQQRGIEQVTHAVSQMDSVTQQNAALVEEASATAQALDHQARSLSASVAVFSL